MAAECETDIDALIRDLEVVVRCARCHQIVQESFSSSVCRHTFCGSCVEHIFAKSPSFCPSCHVQIWRHNVRFNPVLASVVQYVTTLGREYYPNVDDRQAERAEPDTESENNDELMVSPPLTTSGHEPVSPMLSSAGVRTPPKRTIGEGDRSSPSWPASQPSSLIALQERHQQLVNSYADMNLSAVLSSFDPASTCETPCLTPITETQPSPSPPITTTIVFQTSGLTSQKQVIEDRLVGLGAIVAEDIEECTHLVIAVDGRKRCQRTLKYAVALLRGIWIVSDQWVNQCIEQRCWVDESDFEVIGDASVTEITKAPRRSRLSPVAIFAGCDLAMDEGSELPDVEPLIRLGGGRVVQPRPDADTGDHVVMVCEHGLSKKRAKQLAKHHNIVPVSIAWLFDCCSHLERISYESYRLDVP